MLFFLFHTVASAATLTVGAPYATIQEAVDDSVAGDTVQVPAGVWFGDVDVPHELILDAPEGPAETTLVGCLTLDGDVRVSGFKLSPVRDVPAVYADYGSRGDLDNVEITRERGRTPLLRMYALETSITNSHIHSSTLSGEAPAIVTGSGPFVLRDSLVEDIYAPWLIFSNTRGQAISYTGNTIRNNVAEYELMLFKAMDVNGSIAFRDNDVHGNVGGTTAVIKAILDHGYRLRMTGNRFADNVGSTGVIEAKHFTDGRYWDFLMHSNTFVANTADAVVRVHHDVLMRVANNIFAHNEGVAFDTVEVSRFFDHNLWWDNDVNALGVSPGDSAVLLDPLFVAFTDNGDPTDDDLGVQAASPALGAGIGPGGSTRDIGAL